MRGMGRRRESMLYGAAAVFVTAFCLVLAIAGWNRVQEESIRLDRLSTAIDQELNEVVHSARLLLATLAGYRQSLEQADAAGLTTLSRIALRQNPYIHALYHFEWVPADRRAAFEARLRSRGIGDSPIRRCCAETNGPGMLGGRRGHLAAVFVEPESAGRVRQLGWDLLSGVARPEELEEAIRLAEPVPLHVLPEFGFPSEAMILVQATYEGRRVPVEAVERMRRFSGLLLTVVDVQRLVAAWRKRNPGYRINLTNGLSLTGASWIRREPEWRLQADLHHPVRLWHASRLSTGHRVGIERILAPSRLWGERALTTALVVGLLCMVSFLLWRGQRRQRRMAALARRALDRERDRAHKTLHAIGDAVLVVDDDWRIRYVNPMGERMLGLSGAQIQGRILDEVVNLFDGCHGRPVEDLRSHFLSQSADGACAAMILVGADGERIAVDSRVSPLTFPDGNDGMVIVMRDVSREHKLMEELAYQATHDALTGLYNRSAFENHLRHLLEEETGGHALIYLDLDRFKLVNDTCGHAAGDELLKRTAVQIGEVLRKGDLLARVGGDEFGILLRNCTPEAAERIARRLMESIEAFRFRWEDKVLQVHTSIGVVPLGGEETTLKDVLMAADLACHVAKERGRNRVHVHAVEDVSVHRHHQEMQWLPRLHEALDNDRFELFVQPIRPLDEASGLPVMNEFLVRLRNHDGKLLPPGLFIPAAERYDLMWQIDRWIVENAISHLAVTEDRGERYTINLSAQTFSDRSFADFVRMTLEGYGVATDRVCFELTETAAVTNIAVAGELMQALKDLGCRILLDDFGSGLSSFGYLKNLPFDYLKIDGQFVRDILTDPLDGVMVRMCRELAQVLGVKTVAEFIESEEILEAVKAVGIDYGQGYHLGRPRPARTQVADQRALG